MVSLSGLRICHGYRDLSWLSAAWFISSGEVPCEGSLRILRSGRIWDVYNCVCTVLSLS